MLVATEFEQLTYFNFLSHMILRSEKPGTKQPAWLCSSEEAKAEANSKALVFCNTNFGSIVPFQLCDLDRINKVLARNPVMKSNYKKWIDEETFLKGQRELGNPLAFFCVN